MSEAGAAGGERTLLVVAAAAASRADRFLAGALPELSRSRIKQLIEAACVHCDGAVLLAPDAPVRQGARFSLVLPVPTDAVPRAEAIALDILFEDADLIVLDKPAGLVVHPAPGSPDGTLVNALLAHCGSALPGIGGERRPGIVHRLDKDTSGVMVVAKSERALTRLSAAFAARDLERAYLAICWGRPVPPAGEIEGAIGRDPRDRKRMAITRGGKPALTRYATLKSWLNAASLLECRLATGRTHQIRVHLASRGYPLVGDPVYLRRIPALAKLLPPSMRGQLLDFPRQALHATTLAFDHPVTQVKLSFTRPPPAGFRDAAERSERNILTGPSWSCINCALVRWMPGLIAVRSRPATWGLRRDNKAYVGIHPLPGETAASSATYIQVRTLYPGFKEPCHGLCCRQRRS